MDVDGKVVTLTFDDEINANLTTQVGTVFKFFVDGVKAKDGKTIEKFTTNLSVNDEVAPEVVSTKATAKTTTNKVTVTFNEPVSATGVVANVGGQSATVQAGALANQLVLTSSVNLEAGKTYDITVLNVKDYAGNFLKVNPTKTSVTVTSDVLAPSITKVEAVRDNLIAVTFDKVMDRNTFAGQVKLINAAGDAKGGSITAASSSVDGKTVYLSLGTEDMFANSNTFNGTLYLGDSIADVSGNKIVAVSKSVTTTKDTVKPVANSSKYLAPGTVYTNNAAYTNGAIVVKYSEGVNKGTTTGIKILSAAGVDVTSTYVDNSTSDPLMNTADATELIIPLKAVLPKGDFRVVLAGGEVTDKSFGANLNAAQTVTFSSTAVSDTNKPVVNVTPSGSGGKLVVTAATNLSSGTTIKLGITDDRGLNLATVQDVNNYLLDGAALPAGTYVEVEHNAGSSDAAATDVDVTLHIPKNTISKEGTHVLNVVNIKDTNNNFAAPVTANVTLVDDVAPLLAGASIASNGSLVLSFSENAVFGAGAKGEFDFLINGKTVAGTLALVTGTPGIGNDAGKLVLTFGARVDAGADANAATTADNRLYIDVNGDGKYDAANGDILIKTGTTTAVSTTVVPGDTAFTDSKAPTTTVSVNDFASLQVIVVNSPSASNIKDTSSLNNKLVADTKITVK